MIDQFYFTVHYHVTINIIYQNKKDGTMNFKTHNHINAKTTKRFKLYKSGKLWLVAGVTFVHLLVAQSSTIKLRTLTQ
ncbi:KxYKxGKxW signal peptide domain-containing protein [Lactiplantibacillus plantarum]|nr:KxYKxGKxW signal peptide domain-containing protein [Lactiplantibacillus plantarum]